MNSELGRNERKTYYILILLCIAVYLVSWTIPLMEVDAVQYANLSREMLLHKSFLQVYDQGQDYLDKPPMLFWLSSLSMYVFGINDMAYRLPSFLFALLAIYSTYRLALLFYSEKMALLSALVLAGSQAMFLINHDVRTDTMLMGWVTLSLWQLAAWLQHNKWKHLVTGSIAIAGGMLTKGPIALMIPVFAFVPHLMLKRNFKDLFRWQYLIVLVIAAILLIPMSIGLYEQFDMHPEKTVNGQQHVSGLKFFFWTQSFGRITGSNTLRENDSFFFLFQNMLWSLLPWILFFILGLFYAVKDLVQKRFLLAENEEWISTGGFIITYCALAKSSAQLPHYIFVVFPLAAIIIARFLYTLLYTDILKNWKKPLFIIHAVIFSLLAVVLGMLLYFPFPPVNWLLLTLFLVFCCLVILLVMKKWLPVPSLIALLVPAIIGINFLMDLGFYSPLLQYEAGVKVNEIIKQEHYDKDHFFVYKMGERRSLDFYGNHSFLAVNDPDLLGTSDYLLTSADGMALIDKTKYKILYTGQGFHVSLLTLPFLNPATRNTDTYPYFILQRR